MTDLENAMLDACHQGNTEEVEKALASGMSPDIEDEGHYSALHLAAMGGHLDVVKVLVEKGARLESSDPPKGYEHLKIGNALYYAAGEGHAGIVEYLADKGADVNCVSPMGVSSLMLAVEQGHGDVVTVLTTRKAALELANSDGMTRRRRHLAMRCDAVPAGQWMPQCRLRPRGASYLVPVMKRVL